MKQSSDSSIFSLADVLTVLTAVGFGFICFLGKNFYTLGNTSESITWGVVIALLLAGTALGAKLLKRVSGSFRTMFIMEISMLVLFTSLTAYFSFTIFPHFFNVSSNKAAIQSKIQTGIAQAENMFVEYELYVNNRKINYKGQLEAAVNTKNINGKEYSTYGFSSNGVSDNVQIGNKMFTISADLLPPTYSDTSGNNGIKEVAISWLTKAKNITNSWKPIGIVNVVNDVENKSKGWLNQLVNFSQYAQKGERNYLPFNYSLQFTNVKTYFTSLSGPTLLSISLALAAYILMILSWFVTKRHSRRTGVMTNAPYEIVLK